MKHITRVLAVTVAAVGVFALVGAAAQPAEACGGQKVVKKTDWDNKTAEVMVIPVQGMTCEGCAQTIEAAVTGLDGVVAVEISFTDGTARVAYQPTRVTMATIVDVIETAGGGYKTGPPAAQPKRSS